MYYLICHVNSVSPQDMGSLTSLYLEALGNTWRDIKIYKAFVLNSLTDVFHIKAASPSHAFCKTQYEQLASKNW